MKFERNKALHCNDDRNSTNNSDNQDLSSYMMIEKYGENIEEADLLCSSPSTSRVPVLPVNLLQSIRQHTRKPSVHYDIPTEIRTATALVLESLKEYKRLQHHNTSQTRVNSMIPNDMDDDDNAEIEFRRPLHSTYNNSNNHTLHHRHLSQLNSPCHYADLSPPYEVKERIKESESNCQGIKRTTRGRRRIFFPKALLEEIRHRYRPRSCKNDEAQVKSKLSSSLLSSSQRKVTFAVISGEDDDVMTNKNSHTTNADIDGGSATNIPIITKRNRYKKNNLTIHIPEDTSKSIHVKLNNCNDACGTDRDIKSGCSNSNISKPRVRFDVKNLLEMKTKTLDYSLKQQASVLTSTSTITATTATPTTTNTVSSTDVFSTVVNTVSASAAINTISVNSAVDTVVDSVKHHANTLLQQTHLIQTTKRRCILKAIHAKLLLLNATNKSQAFIQQANHDKMIIHTTAKFSANTILQQANLQSVLMKAKIKQEQYIWDQEKLKIAKIQLFSSPSQLIHLNIGGVIYTTTLTTLTRFIDSTLAQMFSGRHLLTSITTSAHNTNNAIADVSHTVNAANDSSTTTVSNVHETNNNTNNIYFIDRDGTYFRHILNFLRDPSVYTMMNNSSSNNNSVTSSNIMSSADTVTTTTTTTTTVSQEYALRVEAKYYGLLDYMFPIATEPTIIRFKYNHYIHEGLCRKVTNQMIIYEDKIDRYWYARFKFESGVGMQKWRVYYCQSCGNNWCALGNKDNSSNNNTNNNTNNNNTNNSNNNSNNMTNNSNIIDNNYIYNHSNSSNRGGEVRSGKIRHILLPGFRQSERIQHCPGNREVCSQCHRQ